MTFVRSFVLSIRSPFFSNNFSGFFTKAENFLLESSKIIGTPSIARLLQRLLIC